MVGGQFYSMNQVVKKFVELAKQVPKNEAAAQEHKKIAADAIGKISHLENQEVKNLPKNKVLYHAVKTMGNILARIGFGGLSRQKVIETKLKEYANEGKVDQKIRNQGGSVTAKNAPPPRPPRNKIESPQEKIATSVPSKPIVQPKADVSKPSLTNADLVKKIRSGIQGDELKNAIQGLEMEDLSLVDLKSLFIPIPGDSVRGNYVETIRRVPLVSPEQILKIMANGQLYEDEKRAFILQLQRTQLQQVDVSRLDPLEIRMILNSKSITQFTKDQLSFLSEHLNFMDLHIVILVWDNSSAEILRSLDMSKIDKNALKPWIMDNSSLLFSVLNKEQWNSIDKHLNAPEITELINKQTKLTSSNTDKLNEID